MIELRISEADDCITSIEMTKEELMLINIAIDISCYFNSRMNTNNKKAYWSISEKICKLLEATRD